MQKLILILFPLFSYAQDVPIGQWKDYLPYNNAQHIAIDNDKVYCITDGGIFYYNKDDNSINRLSKINGLSDIQAILAAYDEQTKTLLIAYSNTNIDLLINNHIINISDIKRKSMNGIKSINNIIFNDGIAYLSCSFGIVVIDINKGEVKDTYKIGENTDYVSVNQTAFMNDSIYVATSKGIYTAASSNLFLSDYQQWTKMKNFHNTSFIDANFNAIISFNNTLFSSINLPKDSILMYQNNIWNSFSNTGYIQANINESNEKLVIIDSNCITIYSSNLDSTYSIKNLNNAQFALFDNDEMLWVADKSGLSYYKYENKLETITPEGAKENTIFSLEFSKDKLYICHGGHLNFGYLWNKNGVSVMSISDEWRNYDYYELNNARDIVAVASYNNNDFFASYYNGVVELKDEEFYTRHSYHNTDGGLDTIPDWANDKRIAVADLKFDKEGNLWGLTSGVNHPLFVKTKEDEWYSFSLTGERFHYDEILIDRYNQKWGIIGKGEGIFVYNDNNTTTDPSDDQYKYLTTNIGNGSLPSMYSYSIVEDLDGEIWIGTDKGIGVFYNPSSVFSGGNFDAQQILIQEGDYGQYLLSTETVKCITIDGANRKWVGTEKSGVFLLSDDGTEEIQHFTTDNSPLFSDNIIDIAIDPNNGEVFIGTEKGLLSYRSDATIGANTQNNTTVFPNPVREDYHGLIAINGLITDANVKITDIKSNIVFETFAQGGQATWNGLTQDGNRVQTGVYLVFSSDINGEEKIVSKILFIH